MESIRMRRGLAISALTLSLLAGVITFGLVGTTPVKANGAAGTSASYGGGRLMAADPNGGYWTVTGGDAVIAHGGAPSLGSPAASGLRLTEPIVGLAATHDGQGYWLVASDGGVFSYGDAKFYGSAGALHLNQPIVGMTATADGLGYWLVASDGGIFTYGDARFLGSTGAIHLNKPIVGMAAAADGAGYWLVASDGGIFTYGDAKFFGSTGALALNEPIVGMARSTDGQGYWLVASDGGIFTFGDAKFYGTSGGGTSVLGIIVNPSATGYQLVESDGVSVNPTLTPSAANNSQSLLDGTYTGAANPSGLAAFDAATGSSSQIASDYLPSNSGWSGMDGAGGTLSWLTRAWAGSGYTLSLGVPIIPTNSSGAAEGSLATGATGAYNGYFVTLAQTLVAAGESNAFLRLGWEFDYVGGYPWTVANGAEAASYAAYFDQIVTAMRSVPGENFSFVWNPDAGAFIESGYDVALSYPGNAYVNVIGIDAYDESWASPHTASTAWAVTTLPALSAARAFAAAEGKPLAVCEWGVAFAGQGLGDDPLYVNNMAAWMHNSANDVLYESYFNYNGSSDSALTSGKAPASLAAFRADFG
jgi:hypothetical protein